MSDIDIVFNLTLITFYNFLHDISVNCVKQQLILLDSKYLFHTSS